MTGEIPAGLAELSGLTSLRLGGNNFDDTCVPHDLKDNINIVSASNPPYCLSEVAKGIQADREALQAFYKYTSETEWDKYLGEIKKKFSDAGKEEWSESCYFGENGPEDLSRWCGVTTNEDGRVITLDFGGIGLLDGTVSLKGSIPPELGKMDELRLLDLSGGEDTGERLFEFIDIIEIGDKGGLTGAIPESLGNLPKLKVLNLSGNKLGKENKLDKEKLSGTVPISLANLFDTLDEMDLSDNDLQRGMRGLLEVDVDLPRLAGDWIKVNVSNNNWAGDEGEYWKEFEGEITRGFVDLGKLILTKKYPELGVTNAESLKNYFVEKGAKNIKARAVSQIAKGAAQSTSQRIIASVLIRGTTAVLATGSVVGWVVFAIDAGNIAFSVVSAGLDLFEATAGNIARKASEDIWGSDSFINYLACVNAPEGGTSQCEHLLE